MRVRRLFPRNSDDFRFELRTLGGSIEEIIALLPKRETLLLRLSELSGDDVDALRTSVSHAGESGAFYLDETHSQAILMIYPERWEKDRIRFGNNSPHWFRLTRQIESFLSQSADTGRAFRVGDRVYARKGRPYLMGILNVTPDSFSDGGQFLDPDRALEQAHRMVDEGADFIDVGGESSRPGAQPVPLAEEIRRVIPLVQELAKEIPVPISVDTTKADVAQRALDVGACLINDISALSGDENMADVIAAEDAAVILMHMQGMPRTMQDYPYYHDLMDEIHRFLWERISLAKQSGISEDRILIDPGIGFGKRLDDNFELLGRLREFSDLGPVLVGPSRKSFIGKVLDLPVNERLYGTAAAAAVATVNGVDVLRVHDVKPMLEVVEIAGRCITGTARQASD